MIRVVIAAASDVARAGLASLLGRISDVDIVGRAAEADALASAIRTLSPDVVFVDLESRRGNDAALLSATTEDARWPALVILADDPVDVELRPALGQVPGRASGGWALLPRHSSPVEIEAAMRAAMAGLIITHPLLADRDARVSVPHSTLDQSLLTPREIEVLRMLAAGLPNKTIANRLGVSAHTVKFHVGSIMTKLHAASRTEAVTEGIRRGLIFV
jgi:DNA-binding NarL/FixJ family response regulator